MGNMYAGRGRIVVKPTGSGCWYAVKVDRHGNELERGPVREKEYEAAEHADNYRRFGAWNRS